MLLALQKSNREFSLRRLLGIPFRCIVITISCGVLRLRRFCRFAENRSAQDDRLRSEDRKITPPL